MTRNERRTMLQRLGVIVSAACLAAACGGSTSGDESNDAVWSPGSSLVGQDVPVPGGITATLDGESGLAVAAVFLVDGSDGIELTDTGFVCTEEGTWQLGGEVVVAASLAGPAPTIKAEGDWVCGTGGGGPPDSTTTTSSTVPDDPSPIPEEKVVPPLKPLEEIIELFPEEAQPTSGSFLVKEDPADDARPFPPTLGSAPDHPSQLDVLAWYLVALIFADTDEAVDAQLRIFGAGGPFDCAEAFIICPDALRLLRGAYALNVFAMAEESDPANPTRLGATDQSQTQIMVSLDRAGVENEATVGVPNEGRDLFVFFGGDGLTTVDRSSGQFRQVDSSDLTTGTAIGVFDDSIFVFHPIGGEAASWTSPDGPVVADFDGEGIDDIGVWRPYSYSFFNRTDPEVDSASFDDIHVTGSETGRIAMPWGSASG